MHIPDILPHFLPEKEPHILAFPDSLPEETGGDLYERGLRDSNTGFW